MKNTYYNDLPFEAQDLVFGNNKSRTDIFKMINLDKFNFSYKEMIILKYLMNININDIMLDTHFNIFKNNLKNKTNVENEINLIQNLISNNLQIAYSLPNLDFLIDKIKNYEEFYNELGQLINSEDVKGISDKYTKFTKTFYLWHKIYLYSKSKINLSKVQFTPDYCFNLDFQLIDIFLQVLNKSHLESYIAYLKRFAATNFIGHSIIEVKFKLDFLYDFHKTYIENENIKTSISEAEFYDKTYDILKRLRLKSSYESFKKAMNGENVTLEFYEKGKVFTADYKIIPDTTISLFFQLLKEIHQDNGKPLFNFNEVTFILDDEKIGLKTLLRKIDTRKYGKVKFIQNDDVLKNIKEKVQDFEEWILMLSYLYNIKIRLNFDYFNFIEPNSTNSVNFADFNLSNMNIIKI